MRQNKLLTAGENVSLSSRASAAALRHGGRDYIRDADQIERTPQILTLSDLLQGVFAVVMKTKNGDEVKVSLKVAALLIGAVLVFCGWATYMIRSNARLEANVQNMADNQRAYEARQDSQQREYQTQIITAMATTDAYIAHQTNRMQKVESLMPKWAQAELTEWDVTHPAPQRIKPENFRFNQSTPNEQNEQGKQVHFERSRL